MRSSVKQAFTEHYRLLKRGVFLNSLDVTEFYGELKHEDAGLIRFQVG